MCKHHFDVAADKGGADINPFVLIQHNFKNCNTVIIFSVTKNGFSMFGQSGCRFLFGANIT